MTRLSLLIAAALALSPAAAHAARPAACWFENGVVVVSGEMMGVAADFILDTASPRTLLADSQAQGAGFRGSGLIGTVRFAGESVTDLPIAVQTLDLRTGALPTPVAGVIGADALRRFVVEVRFRPCRVTLNPRTPFRARTALPMTWIADRPTVPARVSDGATRLSGAFTPGVGADREVRISDAVADAPGARVRKELYPYGVLKPRLSGLAFAGRAASDLPSGLMAAEDPALLGQLGAPYLARYRLRFDFPRSRLLVGAP